MLKQLPDYQRLTDDPNDPNKYYIKNQWLYRAPRAPWRWPSVESVLLFPIRLLLYPIIAPVALIVNYQLTVQSKHIDKEYPWHSFSVYGSNGEGIKVNAYNYLNDLTEGDLQTVYSNSDLISDDINDDSKDDLQFAKDSDLTRANKTSSNSHSEDNYESVNSNSSNKIKKLHIHVAGVGGCANQFNNVAEETAKQFATDVWNVTRNQGYTLAYQKEQIRMLIAAAIEKGYTDIRLDGFSYGAGLVRTVYHDLMQDTGYREYFKQNNIVLHYTARNGYESEMLLVAGTLTGFGDKTDNVDWTKNSQQAPQPTLFMRLMDYLHIFPLFNISLRNKEIDGYDIQPESKNYVVSVVPKTKGESTILYRDGVIQLHNRTNDIKKYGHTCIDFSVEVQGVLSNQVARHCIGIQQEVFIDINKCIFNKLDLIDNTVATLTKEILDNETDDNKKIKTFNHLRYMRLRLLSYADLLTKETSDNEAEQAVSLLRSKVNVFNKLLSQSTEIITVIKQLETIEKKMDSLDIHERAAVNKQFGFPLSQLVSGVAKLETIKLLCKDKKILDNAKNNCIDELKYREKIDQHHDKMQQYMILGCLVFFISPLLSLYCYHLATQTCKKRDEAINDFAKLKCMTFCPRLDNSGKMSEDVSEMIKPKQQFPPI